MASGGEMSDIKLLQHYSHHLNFPAPTPITREVLLSMQRPGPQCPLIREDHQLYARQCLSFSDTQHPWHTDQAYHYPAVPASVQVTHTPDLGLLCPSDIQPVVETSSTMPSSTAMNERYGNYLMSASYSIDDPCHNAARWDDHAAFNLPMNLWSTSDRQPLTPLVVQETNTLWHNSLDQSSANPPPAWSSHVTRSHYSDLSNDENAIAPFIPHHLPLYQSFNQSPPYCSPHPTSTAFPETGPHSHLSFYRVPHRDSTGLSYRRRATCAIEYNGLSIDVEDLLKGLAEPDEKLNIHQCRWEEDRSPCHLWISGDKSSINAHIQRWHGGKPGEEKLQVNCRWPACGKTMLKESIARHILSIHLGQVWECQGCGKEISRNDSYGQHAARSKFEACRKAGPLIAYSPDALEIDARAALDSGGRLRYAGACV